MHSVPRIVVITRKTPYTLLLERHGTQAQAAFFLRSRGQELDGVRAAHWTFERALQTVVQAIPARWRQARLDRGELDRFLFEPGDVIVAVGQDGLVANVAKYLEGQLVIGICDDPSRSDGILVPHSPKAAERLILCAGQGQATEVEERVMVEAQLDDGQRLRALNELFIGHQSHQSARYRLCWRGEEERQSSSGLIVTTGTGATGWARSIVRERRCSVELPAPTEERLAFFVREAFPGAGAGVRHTEGELQGADELQIISEMDDEGVVFGDGIEADRLSVGWGQRIRVGVAPTRLHLVHG